MDRDLLLQTSHIFDHDNAYLIYLSSFPVMYFPQEVFSIDEQSSISDFRLLNVGRDPVNSQWTHGSFSL